VTLRTLSLGLLVVVGATGQERPFEAPPELQTFVRRVTLGHTGVRAKLQALPGAIYRPVEDGGLGMTYDGSVTRTVAEVWRDRKANCLSMTAFFVAACDSIGVNVQYAEALNTNRWRRVGSLIRLERHVVSLVQIPPGEDLVADFLPQLRRRMGVYRVAILTERRMEALFHANRAVERMEEGNLEEALERARWAIRVDPELSTGWNIQGVVERALGQDEAAERSYRRALQLEPRDSTALGNLEALLRETGRVEEAETLRALALDVRKRDPYFHAFLAEEAMAENRLEEALQRIDTAIRLMPHDPDFYLAKARIHLMAGRLDAASKAIEEAKRHDRPSARAHYDSKMEAIKKLKAGEGSTRP